MFDLKVVDKCESFPYISTPFLPASNRIVSLSPRISVTCTCMSNVKMDFNGQQPFNDRIEGGGAAQSFLGPAHCSCLPTY